MNIADVHLYFGTFHVDQCVMNGNTRMRISPWINDDRDLTFDTTLYHINELSFMIALMKMKGDGWEVLDQNLL